MIRIRDGGDENDREVMVVQLSRCGQQITHRIRIFVAWVTNPCVAVLRNFRTVLRPNQQERSALLSSLIEIAVLLLDWPEYPPTPRSTTAMGCKPMPRSRRLLTEAQHRARPPASLEEVSHEAHIPDKAPANPPPCTADDRACSEA